MDNLVFSKSKALHTSRQYPVGVREDAFNAICEIADRTGRSRTEIATKMILHAYKYTVIED